MNTYYCTIFYILDLLWKGVTPYHRKVPVFHHKRKIWILFCGFLCHLLNIREFLFGGQNFYTWQFSLKIWVGILVRRRKNIIHLHKKSFFWKHFFQRLYPHREFWKGGVTFHCIIDKCIQHFTSATVSLNFFVIKIVVRMYFSVNSYTLTIIYQLSESMMLQC